MKKKRILLINSPNEVDECKKNANYALFPHIGIVQLATRIIKDHGQHVDVTIIDGGISTTEKIIDTIILKKPDIVGISVLTPTYGEGLKIADAAKQSGSLVILGDEHAIFFPELILRNRSYIDFIIANDVGEQPFSELIGALIHGTPLSQVSSLYYRDKGKVQINLTKKYNLKDMNTIPDLSLIEDKLDIYADNYLTEQGRFHQKKMRVITLNNARGCENGRVRCSYCSIADLGINTGVPEHFWNTVRHYYEVYGITLFFEVYDSFTASPPYVEALLATMPEDIEKLIQNQEIEFMVYARALGLLKKNNIQKLKKLGVTKVNIGLDSGDPQMLEAQRKNKTTDETNILALKSLSDAGMSVHGSYIMGAPGETYASVQHTVDHIIATLKEVKFSTVEVSRLFPLANSPIWDMMIDFEQPKFYKSSDEINENLKKLNIHTPYDERVTVRDKYKNHDLINNEEIIDDWYKTYTHIDQAFVLEKVREIDQIIESYDVNTGNNIG